MKALLIPTDDIPRIINIDSYKDLRKAVDGPIDAMGWVFNDEPCLYINDEGKFTKEPNRAIYATQDHAGMQTWDGEEVKPGKLLDIIYGDFVAIGFDPLTGEDKDITDEEIEKVMKTFGKHTIFSGLIEALKIKAEGHR